MPDLPDLPRFTGGLVGYFGYDTVRYVESRLAKSMPKDQLGTPDVLLMASDEVAIFDNLSGTIMLVVHIDAKEAEALARAEARLDKLEEQLSQPIPDLPLWIQGVKASQKRILNRALVKRITSRQLR